MKYFYSCLLVWLNTFLFAQDVTQHSWSANYQKSRSFIENAGQFNSFETETTGNIRYAVDFGSTRIFFGDKGIGYSFLEAVKIPKSEREEIARRLPRSVEEHKQFEKIVGKFKYKSDWVNMQWLQRSHECKLKGMDETTDYHSYGYRDESGLIKGADKAKGYKRIVYQNCYPGIDIEYTIHPEIGVKYALIVHPGANTSLVRMEYDRAITTIDGAIHIPTSFGDIIDHAPLTFYENNHADVISSLFVQEHNQVTFDIANYDKNRTIVIDPWTQTPSFNTNWDVVWECEYDGAGNTYILGGIMPMQVLKYNTSGALQWTYNTPYDTSNCWLGTLATDVNGNSYVTRGSVSGIQKISPAGALIWNNNGGGGSIGNSDEYWSIAFNCDQTGLVVGGTSGAFALPPLLEAAIFNLNTANGNILNTRDVAVGPSFSIPPNVQEVRSIAAGPNGKYYFLTQDTIGYISDNFTLCSGVATDLEKINNGIDLGYKCEDYRYDNTGICALVADDNALFVHKGNQIQKRSLITLAVLSSVNLPNGSFLNQGLGINAVANSGIAVDDCGNVYAGSTDGVYKFNSNLVQQTFFPTSFKVYDVEVNANGEVIACGGTGTSASGTRSGGIQSFAAGACAPIATTCCDATICQPNTFCANDPSFTLVTATAGGTWSGPGVSSSGVFSPAIAGVGTHSITYTLPCGSETISIVVSSCQSMTICEDSNGDFTVSGGVGPYTWAELIPASNSPITNQAECQACGYTWNAGFPPFLPAQCLNNLLQTVTTCSTPASFANFGTGTSVSPPSGATEIQVTDGSGAVVTVLVSSIIPCDSIPCPTILVTNASVSNVLCYDASTGSATLQATGGTAPYTFVWQPGNLSGSTQTNLAAGSYNISVLDANNCPGTGTVNITQPTSALTATSSSTGTSCTSSTGTASVTASGGTAPYNYSWSPGGSTNANLSNLSSGTYIATVTDNSGCQTTTTAIVSASDGPNITATNTENVSCSGLADGAIDVNVSGGTGTVNVTWSPGGSSGLSQSNLGAGTYLITATDANNCSNSISITLTEPDPIEIMQGTIVPATCGIADGSGTVSVTGGTGALTYTWSPSGGNGLTLTNVTSGAYTFTATDANNCSANSTIIITNSNGPAVSISNFTDVSCVGNSDGSATAVASGGTAPYNFEWFPSGGSTGSALNLSAGNYTVVVTDAQDCVGSATVIIGSPAPLVITETITPTSCTANTGQISLAVSGGNAPYTFNWQPGGGNTSSLNNLSAGNYNVTITDDAGCSASENYLLTANGTIPIIASPSSVSIFEGDSVTLTASGGISYLWEPNDALSCDTCSSTIASPDLTTLYTVTGTDANGCTGTADVLVNVQKICGDFYVPTAFSPDGNEVDANKKVCVYGVCIAEFYYRVYNRWGQLVFESADQNKCWDGTFKGAPQHAGAYAYRLEITLENGENIQQSGSLTLIR